jgi:hypothetical protein
LLWVLASLAHPLKRRRIDVRGVTGSVDLNVTAASFNQAANHLTLNLHNVCYELTYVCIHGLGFLQVKPLRNSIRPNERHLRRSLSHLAQQTKFFQRRILDQAQALNGGVA